MNYYLDLFTPETWAAFRQHGSKISGFREHQRASAANVAPGDLFLCYVVRLSRWCGVLRVRTGPYHDTAPIFSDPDPFVVRFDVEPVVQLDLTASIPIFEPNLWSRLSFTRELPIRVFGWAQFANLRASLRAVPFDDGRLLEELLKGQLTSGKTYPLTAQDESRLKVKQSVRTADGEVLVEVPEKEEEVDESEADIRAETFRTSHQMQAAVARIGASMGFRIWVPRSDRQAIQDQLSQDLHASFLDILPLNYDEPTLKTVEQIDVIWLKGRSMARAFEVEHTTAIYSGLLRMADLLALQPNMEIKLHIVTPDEKREKVLREIKRPVFALLERGPLYKHCTFLSYSAIDEISRTKHLSHMSASILDEYDEAADEL